MDRQFHPSLRASEREGLQSEPCQLVWQVLQAGMVRRCVEATRPPGALGLDPCPGGDWRDGGTPERQVGGQAAHTNRRWMGLSLRSRRPFGGFMRPVAGGACRQSMSQSRLDGVETPENSAWMSGKRRGYRFLHAGCALEPVEAIARPARSQLASIYRLPPRHPCTRIARRLWAVFGWALVGRSLAARW